MRNYFYRLCIVVITGLLPGITNLYAQQSDQVKQAMQKLKDAQKIMDSVKRLIPAVGNIGVAGRYGVPADSAIKGGLPDFNKMAANMQQNVNNLQTLQQQSKQQRDAGLPKATDNRVTAFTAADENGVIAIANALLPSVTKSIDSAAPFLRQKLDKIVTDTGVNVAGTGMVLLASDAPTYVGEYLICKGVIRNPGNLWSVNDLGIILRNRKMFEQAIQCFTYACSFSDSLYIIKANLGWACAYYGDFDAAKKYFNQSLAVNPNFSGVEEGLALIAYQQGNVQALFSCLAKEIKGFGVGGPGPSDAFANICGGVQMDNSVNNLNGGGSQDDPTSDHTYENANGDDGNQDPPPTAETEPITYPSMSRIFSNTIDDAANIIKSTSAWIDQIKKATQESADKVSAAGASLSRLSPTPYMDDHGDYIKPYSYEKFYKLFHNIHEEFEKRASWIYKQYEDKMGPLLTSVTKQEADDIINYTKKLSECTNDACVNDVKCEWRPKIKGATASGFAAASQLWTDNYKKLIDNINWYVSASSPFIKRVHKPDWNTYMNAIRIDDIHHAALSMFNRWVTAQGTVVSPTYSTLFSMQDIVCTTQIREIAATGPNPADVKLKKLQTYPEYCDNNVSSESISLPGISYSKNCSQMTIQVGSDDAGAFYQRNYSKIAQEKNNTRIGVSLGFGYEESIKANGAGNSSASVKASLKAQVQAGYQYNDDGTVAKFANAEISAGISGKVTTGDDNADKLLQTANFNHGFTVKTEVMSYQGADGNYGGWNLTQLSGTRH